MYLKLNCQKTIYISGRTEWEEVGSLCDRCTPRQCSATGKSYDSSVIDQDPNHRKVKKFALTQLAHGIMNYFLHMSTSMERTHLKIKLYMATQHRISFFFKEALWRRGCPWIALFAKSHGVNNC